VKNCDLSAGVGKLAMALKELQITTIEISESWHDNTNREFVETFVAPLEGQVKALVDSVRRLSEVLGTAERDCRND
jgi:predicted RNA methylase